MHVVVIVIVIVCASMMQYVDGILVTDGCCSSLSQRSSLFCKPRNNTNRYSNVQSLTSIAFTEPLWEDTVHSKNYINFIASHVPLTNKSAFMTNMNISQAELEDVLEHRTMSTTRSPKLDDFLIFRSLEIYLYWHGFINYLNVPIFRLEDLAVDKNVTVLDEIFRSIGRAPPPHDKVMSILNAQEAQRNQLHRERRQRELRRQLQQTPEGLHKRGKRIRKGARIHRPTLTWEEICRASPKKAKSLLKMSHSFGYYLDMDVESVCA